MRKLLAFILVSLFTLPAFAGDAPGIKFRVFVGEFANKASHGWYRGPSPGSGMADMLITELVKSGKFRVFERAALDELLREKNMSMSDLANPSASAQ